MCRSGEILGALGSYFKVNSFTVRMRGGVATPEAAAGVGASGAGTTVSTSLFYFTFISSGPALFHISSHPHWHSPGMFHFKKRFFILILLPQNGRGIQCRFTKFQFRKAEDLQAHVCITTDFTLHLKITSLHRINLNLYLRCGKYHLLYSWDRLSKWKLAPWGAPNYRTHNSRR